MPREDDQIGSPEWWAAFTNAAAAALDRPYEEWERDQVCTLALADRRPGDTLFASDVLDALAIAGIVVEDGVRGIVLHLPNRSGEVPGVALQQMLSKPLCREDLLIKCEAEPVGSNEPSYMRHDPTKKHKGVRAWGKNARGRGR